MNSKELIARRIAKELEDGTFVNLGIGIPTLVGNYIPDDVNIYFHSENGCTHTGPFATEDEKDYELINASDQHITLLPGAALFDSAVSFGLIRGGHLAATVLGGMQVDQEGNLANWKIPGVLMTGMGGGMDLVAGAKKVIIAMEHTSKKGESKILKKCTIPLTGLKCVSMIVTDMAVMEMTEDGLVLKETAPGVSIEQVLAATEADLILDPSVKTMDI